MALRLIAADCETDPFAYGRIPQPFIWGAYDPEGEACDAGGEYKIWHTTAEFVEWLRDQDAIVYAHNGGKFDWVYIIPFIDVNTDVRIIGGRIAEIKVGRATLRDSYSIVPVPLASIQKDDIDYSKMEADVRHLHMAEIISYLKTDVYVLYILIRTYREEAGKAITIASNAMNSARSLGIKPGRTNWRFDQTFRAFYFGGRTECFQPGTHENLSVYDIRSSYPFAMSQGHATGSKHEVHDNFSKIRDEDIYRCFIILQCYSEGAFPIKADDGSLSFPYKFDVFYVTGWEYLTALEYGLIKNVTIKRVYEFPSKINFSSYVDKWYAHKEKHRPRETTEEKAQYTIGKIMMNSLYGKLAMNPLRYFDYRICEPGTELDVDNGWTAYAKFQGKEVHRRSVEFDVQLKWGKEWKGKPLYYNVATGASITGLARANLLAAMCLTGRERVIYCDTDSMVLHGRENPPLDMSPRLGAWDCEFLAERGHFAGKKLYAMRGNEPGKDTIKEKIASKGSKLDFDQLHRIVNGETVEWKNDAPSYSIAKNIDFTRKDIDASQFFVTRSIRSTATSN